MTILITIVIIAYVAYGIKYAIEFHETCQEGDNVFKVLLAGLLSPPLALYGFFRLEGCFIILILSVLLYLFLPG